MGSSKIRIDEACVVCGKQLSEPGIRIPVDIIISERGWPFISSEYNIICKECCGVVFAPFSKALAPKSNIRDIREKISVLSNKMEQISRANQNE